MPGCALGDASRVKSLVAGAQIESHLRTMALNNGLLAERNHVHRLVISHDYRDRLDQRRNVMALNKVVIVHEGHELTAGELDQLVTLLANGATATRIDQGEPFDGMRELPQLRFEGIREPPKAR